MSYFENFVKLTILFFYFSRICCNHENHNRPFGTGRRFDVRNCDGFVEPVEFIKEYVLKNEPLLFKQAAKKWPAMIRWNDDYFLDLDLSGFNVTTVHIEVQKKENRSLETMYLNFKEFVKLYNSSDIYLVDKLPTFLESDISVPWSLQCSLWENAINQVLMWFSSGGTSSVVHTDDMENINCLISGEKTFVLVDPHLHKDKIPMNEKGAYSDIDVDRVDFNKYPGMATVEFQVAHMVPGDCIYIPRLWIHQVRSFHRNIAINIWFSKTKEELEVLSSADLNKYCSQVPLNKTFNGTSFLGLGYSSSPLMDLMKMFANFRPDDLMGKILKAYPELSPDQMKRSESHIKSIISDIFIELDHNKNSIIEMSEIITSTNEAFIRVSNYLKYLKVYLESSTMSADYSNKSPKNVDSPKTSKDHSEL